MNLIFILCLGISNAKQDIVEVASATETLMYFPLVNELLVKSGLQAKYSSFPSERSLMMLKNGEVDIEFFRVKKTVKGLNVPTKLIGPALCSDIVAFVRVDSNFNIKKPEDFKKYKVAAHLGNKVVEEFARTYTVAQQTPISNLESPYLMLEKKRVDVVVDNERMGLVEIRKLNLEKVIKIDGPVLQSTPAYIVLRNHIDLWGPIIESNFKKMKVNGSWDSGFSALSVKSGIPSDVAIRCLKPSK